MSQSDNRDVMDGRGLSEYLGCSYLYACRLIRQIGFPVSERRYKLHVDTLIKYMEQNSLWLKRDA